MNQGKKERTHQETQREWAQKFEEDKEKGRWTVF